MSPGSDERLGPEFPRPFSPEVLGEDEVVENIEASEAERNAVARRLALVSLHRLAAVLRVRRTDGGRVISLTGRFEAEATQTCVVSLKPLSCRVSEEFTSLYSLAPADGGKAGLVEVDAAADDPPEPLGPDGLDLGEVVVQQLAIALDPYPRRDDATMDAPEWVGQDQGETARVSPFEGLKSLGQER